MANMFSGNVEKKIPKNLKDCYKTDNVTKNLWIWSERLEKWGFRLCLFLGITGIISIINDGVKLSLESKTVFEVVINGIIRWFFYCFLEYCSYHILALLAGSLASIVQHTKITANIALYNSAKEEEISDESTNDEAAGDNAVDNNEDKCNELIHKKYISSMKNTDVDSEDAHWEFNQSLRVKTLVCNHCGKELLHINIFEDDEEYKEVICPKCNRKLEFRAAERFGKCPYCEIGFEITER